MTLIERILCKIFPFIDIMQDDTQDLYLRRWFLYPRNKDFGKNKGKGRLYLHKFYRGDECPHLHDHPWPFTSVILTRGYWEETPYDSLAPGNPATPLDWAYRDRVWFKRRFYRPLSLLRRPATWKHRVILKDRNPVWTIVHTGPKERSWGFWIGDKLCNWRDYHRGICCCDDGPTTPDTQSSPVSVDNQLA